MKETLYLTKELAILNYSAGYAHSGDQLLNSSTFSNYVHNYLDYLKADNEALYFYALNGKTTKSGNLTDEQKKQVEELMKANQQSTDTQANTDTSNQKAEQNAGSGASKPW